MSLLASLPALAHRIGGSHAQRDVLRLTLLQAVGHIRRSASPQRWIDLIRNRQPEKRPVTIRLTDRFAWSRGTG
jgi:hypothetical protein